MRWMAEPPALAAVFALAADEYTFCLKYRDICALRLTATESFAAFAPRLPVTETARLPSGAVRRALAFLARP